MKYIIYNDELIKKSENDELKCKPLRSYEIEVLYHGIDELSKLSDDLSIKDLLIYFQFFIDKLISLHKLNQELENIEITIDEKEDIEDFFQKSIEFNQKIVEYYKEHFKNIFISQLEKQNLILLNKYKNQINSLDINYTQIIKDFEIQCKNILKDLEEKEIFKEEGTKVLSKDEVHLNNIYYIYDEKHKNTLECKVIKKNPKFAIVELLNKELISKYKYSPIQKFPYSFLSSDPISIKKSIEKFEFPKSKYNTDLELKNLLNEVKEEYFNEFSNLFNSKEMENLKRVTIFWGKQITHRNAGTYYNNANQIKISASLKYTPDYVIKSVIYHELLHIHFHCHGIEFRKWERKFKEYKQAYEFIEKLFKSISIYGTT